MAKKSSPNNIQDATFINEEAYVTWGDDLESKKEALKTSSESMSEYSIVEKSSAARRYSSDYSNLIPGIDGRPGLTRSDYDYFRPDEAIPKKIKLIIKKAEEIYQRIGLVKNVIDLMGDFGAQGIRLVHENKKIEKFYRTWFKKINGKERSERFLNNLYKTGNIIINRQTAKISLKVTDRLYKTLGSPDLKLNNLDEVRIEKREIPWKYTFMDPFYVEVSAGALSSFSQYKTYELLLPAHLRKTINSPKTQQEIDIINQLPSQIVEAAKTKKPFPLDPDKTLVFHYKKDDWQSWAYPMIYAIMDDINVIEKLKLADMAALDGAISNIRIFKLGNLEHKIAPTKAAAAKLAEILGNNVGGGTMDLVWGPDIELIESKTNVHQFLGEAKYNPHLNSVYAGLGIPPTLTGTFGAAGTTNNFISLKTLTQRLQYGRDLLVEFWEKEISIIQKAMKFKDPARIEFDRMDLSNEEAEKALLIQLADRNLISDELLQTRFGLDPDMEKIRLNRESKERKSAKMVKKSGPWHDPQPENSLKKIALQTGIAAPSQVGLDLYPKKPGEKNSFELKNKLTPTKLAKDSPESLPGQPQQGRPKLSTDKEKRKPKEFAPQTGAAISVWAHKAQDEISDIVNPIMLEFYNKKNLRSLSSAQAKELEELKTEILLRTDPFCIINKDQILKIMSNINYQYLSTYSVWLKSVVSEIGRELSVEEQKQTKATYYALLNQ
jgi:hypothetical protein